MLARLAGLSLTAAGGGPALRALAARPPPALARPLATGAPKAKKEADAGPARPKKPASAWMLYFKDELAREKAADPAVKATAVMKAASERYAGLKAAGGLGQYADAVAADKARYEREMANFKESGGELPAPKPRKSHAKVTPD